MRFEMRWAAASLMPVVLIVGMGLAGCSSSAPTGMPSGTGGTETPAQTASVDHLPGCEGAVVPTLETIEKGEYTPLSRPLYVYINTKALKKPEVAGFVDVMLGKAQQYVEKAGFIKLNEALLKQQQETFKTALGATPIPETITAGTVSVNGSSTVFPFSVVSAELFEKGNSGKVRVTVGKKGTGGGFEKFATGETDISNASRPIKPEEIENCKQHQVEFIELQVCIDGLSVCVNPKNDWCQCLSIEQLKALWEPGSKVQKWSDLNPEWPDRKIQLYGPDGDSGTFDYFTEVVVGKSKSSRADYTQSSEDNVLVRGIAGDVDALGYFGYSYYDKNRATLKVVGIKPPQKSAD